MHFEDLAEAFAYAIRSSSNSNSTSCFSKLKPKVICTAVFLGLILLIYYIDIDIFSEHRKKDIITARVNQLFLGNTLDIHGVVNVETDVLAEKKCTE